MCQKSTNLGKCWWIIELLFLFFTSELDFVQLITHNKDLKVLFCSFWRNFNNLSQIYLNLSTAKWQKKMHFLTKFCWHQHFFPKFFRFVFFFFFTYHLKCLWCKFEVIYIDVWKVIDEYLNPTIYHKLLKVFPSGL